MTPFDTEQLIELQCDTIRELLVSKNRKYGNSALEPSALLARSTPLEQIAIRCDDKLRRIANMGGLAKVLSDPADDGEDTVKDLIGYLILARIAAGLC